MMKRMMRLVSRGVMVSFIPRGADTHHNVMLAQHILIIFQAEKKTLQAF